VRLTRSLLGSLLIVLVLAVLACGGDQPAGKRAPKKKAASGPAVWIELRRGAEPRELVHLGTRGAVIGPEGGPLAVKLFADRRRSDEAWYLLRTYAPFELKTPQGDLVFHSQGKTSPGATEKRMIFEWTRARAAEAAGGQGGSAYGLALSWHQGGSSGICQDVALYLTGEAVASACGWDTEIKGRLDPAQLRRVYDWFDRLQPFQWAAGEQEERPGALESRLVFASRGTQAAKAEEKEEIQTFATSLFAELASRKEGAPPPQTTPGPTPASTTPAPAPPSHLLLPRKLTPPKEGEILLQLPDQPPPPPPGMGIPPVAPRPRPKPPAEATPPAESSPPG
jgi:hypothetical protein